MALGSFMNLDKHIYCNLPTGFAFLNRNYIVVFFEMKKENG